MGARLDTIRHPPSWHQPSSANDDTHNEISISIATDLLPHLLPHRPLESPFRNPSWRETVTVIVSIHAVVLAAGRMKRHVSPFRTEHALPLWQAIPIPTADRQGLRSSNRSHTLHFLPVSPALVLAATAKVSQSLPLVSRAVINQSYQSDQLDTIGLSHAPPEQISKQISNKISENYGMQAFLPLHVSIESEGL